MANSDGRLYHVVYTGRENRRHIISFQMTPILPVIELTRASPNDLARERTDRFRMRELKRAGVVQ